MFRCYVSVRVVTSTGKGTTQSIIQVFVHPNCQDSNLPSVSKTFHQTTSQFAGSYPGSYKLPHFANISTHTTQDPKRREESFGFKKCSTNQSLLDPSRGNKKSQWYTSNSSAEEPNGTIYWRIKQGHLAMRNICAGTQNNKRLEFNTSTIDTNVFGNDALFWLWTRCLTPWSAAQQKKHKLTEEPHTLSNGPFANLSYASFGSCNFNSK